MTDVLGPFAVRGVSFVEIHDARRQVGLVNPKPVTEGPIPPFDSVGGGVTSMGAELIDPTGEQRRARRILNLNADLTLIRGNFDRERHWLELRKIWPNEIRRAVALIHAGEVSGDPGVAFVLAYSALEVLAAPSAVLLSVRISSHSERHALVDSIRVALKKDSRLDDADVARLIYSLSATQVEGPISRFVAAFNAAGIEIATTEMDWVRQQRHSFVHPGRFDVTPEATSRREAFRQMVTALVASQLDGLHRTDIGE